MAEEIVIKIAVSSKQAEKSLKGTKDSVNNLTDAEKKLAAQEKRLAFEASQAGKQFAKNQVELKKLRAANLAAAESANKMADGLKKNTANAGLNNAIVTELSRGASDLRFGFTAVSNNLAQIIDLFRASSKAAGGFFNALSKIFSPQALILIGVQLLISYGDLIFNFFTQTNASAEKLKETMEGLNAEIEGQRVELLGYVEVLKNANANEEARTNALQELETVIPGLTDANNAQKISLEQLTLEVEDYIKQQRLRAELDAIIDNNQELFSKREQIRAAEEKIRNAESAEERRKILAENTGLFEELEALRQGTEGKKGLIARFLEGTDDADIDILKGFQEVSKGTVEEYDKTVARIIEIENQLKSNRDETTSGVEKDNQLRLKLFREGNLDLSKAILDANRKANELEITNQQQRLDLQEEFALKEADRRLSSFKESQNQRQDQYEKQRRQQLDAYIARVKDRDDGEKLIADAQKTFDNAILDSRKNLNQSFVDAELETQELRLAIANDFSTRRILLQDREGQQIASILRKTENIEIERLKRAEGVNEEFYAKKLQQVEQDIETAKFASEDITRTEQQRAQSLLELRKLEDAQRDLELERKIERIEQQKNIDLEYVGFAQGISSLLSNIAGENEALQNAALIVEKGAAIADIVIRTQSANAQITAGHAAAAATESAAIPFSAPANIATQSGFAAAQITRNNISAGISIANILATTMSSFNKPSGSQSSATPSIQAPAFNVVGPSTTDQLLQGVQGSIGDIRVNLNLNEVNDGIDALNTLQQTSEVTS